MRQSRRTTTTLICGILFLYCFSLFAPVVVMVDVGAISYDSPRAYLSPSCFASFDIIGTNYWAGRYSLGCYPVRGNVSLGQ